MGTPPPSPPPPRFIQTPNVLSEISLTSLHRSGSCTRFYPKYHEQHRYLHASNLSFIDANILNIGQYFIIFSNFKVYWILRYYSHRKMIYSINRLAPMWQQSGTLLFCSCHGIAGFLVDELQI